MSGKPWTGKEEQDLVQIYEICRTPAEVASRMPGRTVRSCTLKAIELRKRGITVKRLKKWGADLVGRRYGTRTVIAEGRRGHDSTLLMRCDCGNEIWMNRSYFGSGSHLTCQSCNSARMYRSGKSVPPSRLIDRTGHRFGMWTAIKHKPLMGEKWLFRCDCGTLSVRRVCNVRKQTSCGCHRNPALANRNLLTDYQRLTLICEDT